MKIVRGLIFGLLMAAGLARVSAYLAYASACLPSPLETFHLEAKMVLLSYRAELGEPLYPSWRDHPHVANFFGPAYFWAVGKLGAMAHADIPGLFRIGRGISFASGLLTSLVVGWVVARKYGATAGLSGAILSLGAAPMFGFSVMVRPDLAAEFLGVLGFFLSGRKGWLGSLAGGGLLVLAILTKQTTGIFLLASALGWAAEGDWRRGLRLFAGCLGVVAVLVAAGTWTVEPNFARSLTGESKSPWELASFTRTLGRAATLSPDLFYFPILGLGLWWSRAAGGREPRWAVLAVVLLITSVTLAAKRGADLNYYLSLRVVEGLAVGTTWRAWSFSTSRWRTATLAGLTLLGAVTVVPGLRDATAQASLERTKADFYAGPYGRDLVGFHLEVAAKARNPNSKVLTDYGLLDLYHGKLADFGDPWLFRLLAETGQVDLKVMRDRVDSQYYELIVTTSELEKPTYDSYDFGLPLPLVERARARYVRIGSRAGLFLYGRNELKN